jgi:hypothetical protein
MWNPPPAQAIPEGVGSSFVKKGNGFISEKCWNRRQGCSMRRSRPRRFVRYMGVHIETIHRLWSKPVRKENTAPLLRPRCLNCLCALSPMAWTEFDGDRSLASISLPGVGSLRQLIVCFVVTGRCFQWILQWGRGLPGVASCHPLPLS